ncbi:hypothetical protein P6P90_11665 [Ectobacillus antri]|jgi:tellurite resistance protein TehA-like permease|uniref:DUF4870 domain-containing protein n=1 Tax=Ectobacillus antri TaxID=2486280 RepID=A0ABT6H7E7_9BACI|nr:hypothetical protein [Ectobacillus antri]MDG4657165.1 hypothetical protein [Ectobacillus antri]MDG5754624.1 hypothetical protein [Ectobacillus antri]
MKGMEKVLVAGGYMSLFVLPAILPFILYVACSNREVKYHARVAFASQCVPVAWVGVTFWFFLSAREADAMSLGILFGIVVLGLFNFWIMVWSVGNALRVLVSRKEDVEV